mgnify:CR=1 FL=1
MNHEHYMQRCLQLAELGLANAAPNPSVGAVLVHDDVIIGEGYTSAYGGPHGEVNCIQDARAKLAKVPSGSILYVSLEPCSHFGKTPPCSDLIIKENIATVVIACTDPNPLVAGKGIRKLKDAGIEVIENICQEEALELNKRFFTFHQEKRPYIILKWAQSKEGYFAPDSGKQFWITNPKTKALVHTWRSQEMAILVGAKTVLADNPKLNTRLIEGKDPLRVIINTKEQLNPKSQVFEDELPTLLFSYEKMELTSPKEWIPLNQEQDVIPQILNCLYTKNVNSVIVEGGAFTLQQFIDLGLWDEARILTGKNNLKEGILAPKIEGKIMGEFKFMGDQVNILKQHP